GEGLEVGILEATLLAQNRAVHAPESGDVCPLEHGGSTLGARNRYDDPLRRVPAIYSPLALSQNHRSDSSPVRHVLASVSKSTPRGTECNARTTLIQRVD